MSEKKSFSQFCRATFLSCERYTHLASRALDEPLSFKEKLQFWSHHALCMVCRRFRRQIELIEKAAKRYETTQIDNQTPLGAEVTMPREMKERIESTLREKSQ